MKIEWKGGKAPVAKTTRVRYWLRDDPAEVYEADAGSLRWTWAAPHYRDGAYPDFDIVAYEVLNTVEPNAEELTESQRRKLQPIFSGFLQYFPDAALLVAEHSRKANDKHNPGEPLHWAKGKSTDQADCIGRHLIDIGPTWDAIDPEFGSYHATALAWRAMALLQTVCDREKAKQGS